MKTVIFRHVLHSKVYEVGKTITVLFLFRKVTDHFIVLSLLSFLFCLTPVPLSLHLYHPLLREVYNLFI
jgi:hypothetical protein